MTANVTRPNLEQTASVMPLTQGFLQTADTVRPASPLLAVLAEGSAHDPAMLDLARAIAPGQVPSLLLFVVSFLVGKHPEEPLAAYFAGLAEKPLPAADAFAVFREFCLRRDQEIRPLLATRTLQMTVSERGSVLAFAFDHVAQNVGGPINLLEVGCSAGLLLQFDRYRYEFSGHAPIGDVSSPIVVKTELRGPGSWTPTQLPLVGERLGIDLKLIDPADRDATSWIRACIFPEWLGVKENIDRSLRLLDEAPLPLLQGDALKLLAKAAEDLPDPLCIFHSFCLYQWPDAARTAFEELICEISRRRDIHRVSIENRNRGPGEIVYQVFRDGRPVSGDFLGRCDLFGRWIEVA